jgi:hypothetical protein
MTMPLKLVLLSIQSLSFSVVALRAPGDPEHHQATSYVLDPNDWDTKVIPVSELKDDATSIRPAPLRRSSANHCKDGVGHLTGTRLDIIVFGLMRTFERTWPMAKHQLSLSDMESCGATVNILVSTSLNIRCTEKDYRNGWCSKTWENWSEAEFKKQIRTTYGPRLRYIFDTSARNLAKVNELLNSDEDSIHTMLRNTALRLWSGMNPSGSSATVILRADAWFTTNHVDVVAMCDLQPGYNIISGSKVRPCVVHSRDWDLGAVACNPQVLRLYFNPTETCGSVWPGCVNGTDEPPPLPKGFSGPWHNDRAVARGCVRSSSDRACDLDTCNQVATFMKHNELLGTLDAHGIFLRLLRSRQHSQ